MKIFFVFQLHVIEFSISLHYLTDVLIGLPYYAADSDSVQLFPLPVLMKDYEDTDGTTVNQGTLLPHGFIL